MFFDIKMAVSVRKVSVVIYLSLLGISFLSFDSLGRVHDSNSVSKTKELNTEDLKGSNSLENSDVITKTEKRGPLFDALESTLKCNKELREFQKDLMGIHENHVSALSAFRPKAELNSSYQVSDSENWKKGDPEKLTEGPRVKTYGVRVNQNLFNGLADVAALKEVDLTIKAKWSEYEARKQMILTQVALDYFAIIAKKEEVKHLEALLHARDESRSVVKEMLAAGSSKPLDYAQADASYAETLSRLEVARADYVALCKKFEEESGYKVPQNLSYPEKLFDDTMPEKQAIDIASKNNPEVIAAMNSLSAAKAGVKRINTEFTPSLGLQYGYDQKYNHGKNRSALDDNRNERGHSIALTLSVPIYDGGKSRAEKRQSIENATKAAITKEKVLESLRTQIYSVWAAHRAAKQNLVSVRMAIKARELALHDTNQECDAGVKIIKDVLDAQEQLFESKYMETKAKNDYFSNQCKANALLGRMTAKYLKIKDDGFDYKDHFAKTKRKL